MKKAWSPDWPLFTQGNFVVAAFALAAGYYILAGWFAVGFAVSLAQHLKPVEPPADTLARIEAALKRIDDRTASTAAVVTNALPAAHRPQMARGPVSSMPQGPRQP